MLSRSVQKKTGVQKETQLAFSRMQNIEFSVWRDHKVLRQTILPAHPAQISHLAGES